MGSLKVKVRVWLEPVRAAGLAPPGEVVDGPVVHWVRTPISSTQLATLPGCKPVVLTRFALVIPVLHTVIFVSPEASVQTPVPEAGGVKTPVSPCPSLQVE